MLLLTIIPGLILSGVVWFFDKVEKEPADLLMILFAGGSITTVSAYMLEKFGMIWLNSAVDRNALIYSLLKYFLVVAMSEEAGKLLVLWVISWKHPAFDHTFDAIVYAVTVALGFATAENIVYCFRAGSDMHTIMGRAISSIPIHMMCGVYMGFFYGKAKISEIHRGRSGMAAVWPACAFIVPVILHGTYDMGRGLFFLFTILLSAGGIAQLLFQSKHDRHMKG